MPNIEDIITAAHGEKKVDLLIKNAQVLNVLSGDIHPADVAVYKGIIVGFGDYDAHEILDVKGKVVCPGFIDGHVHLESSMVTVPEFARAVLPLGVTTVVSDLHEISNILGLDGVRYMRECSKNSPLSVYVMCPSCVPSTELETTGSRLEADDMEYLIKDKNVLGLGEMMNYPCIIHRDPRSLQKVMIADNKRIDGHAPMVSGKDLCAYIAAGIYSEHEATDIDEAREKLRLGMYIFIREGTSAQNLEALLPLVNQHNSRRFLFVVDDRNPDDLLKGKEVNEMIKRAIKAGLHPVTAIQIATINVAEYFGLEKLGAIAVGYNADLVVLESLEEISVSTVIKKGELVVVKRNIVEGTIRPCDVRLRGSVNIAWMDISDFAVHAQQGNMKVIEVVPHQLITKKKLIKPLVKDGLVVQDVKNDILKIAVVERHTASGNVGLGFVKGFNLKKGAIASSVAHDSHNIVIIGTSDEDMMSALIEIARMQGGQVVVENGNVIESLQLPIAGIMSRESLEFVDTKIRSLHRAAHSLGCSLEDPFMTLSFMALPVMPELKLTDKGLVDVAKFEIVPLFDEEKVR